MKAGKLRHKIIIQSLTETQDGFGEGIKSPSTFATRRASIKNLRGGEKFTAQQVNSDAQVLFTIRYLSGVTTKMRVSYSGRVFDILYVDNGAERDTETRLECREQT